MTTPYAFPTQAFRLCTLSRHPCREWVRKCANSYGLIFVPENQNHGMQLGMSRVGLHRTGEITRALRATIVPKIARLFKGVLDAHDYCDATWRMVERQINVHPLLGMSVHHQAAIDHSRISHGLRVYRQVWTTCSWKMRIWK